MNLQALDLMLSEVGWRRLVSFREDRFFVVPNAARYPNADARLVGDLLTLADIPWKRSDVFHNYIMIYEPPNP